jgi:hypothetical protein
MKLYKFDEKMPELGTNILVVCGESIGICEFDINAKRHMTRYIKNDGYSGEYYAQELYSDDPQENNEIDLICFEHWCYPSSIKSKPKKKGQL